MNCAPGDAVLIDWRDRGDTARPGPMLRYTDTVSTMGRSRPFQEHVDRGRSSSADARFAASTVRTIRGVRRAKAIRIRWKAWLPFFEKWLSRERTISTL